MNSNTSPANMVAAMHVAGRLASKGDIRGIFCWAYLSHCPTKKKNRGLPKTTATKVTTVPLLLVSGCDAENDFSTDQVAAL